MVRAVAFAALGGLLALGVPAPVQANVIYTFTPDVVTGNTESACKGECTYGVGFELELRDDALRKRSFNLSGFGSDWSMVGPPLFEGDVGNFVQLVLAEAGGSEYVTPTRLNGNIELSLLFSPLGDVSGGRILYGGAGIEVNLSVTENSVSGTWGSDSENCTGCSESGNLARTHVPEPGSLALLGVGALGVGVVSRRRRMAAAA